MTDQYNPLKMCSTPGCRAIYLFGKWVKEGTISTSLYTALTQSNVGNTRIEPCSPECKDGEERRLRRESELAEAAE